MLRPGYPLPGGQVKLSDPPLVVCANPVSAMSSILIAPTYCYPPLKQYGTSLQVVGVGQTRT